MIVPYIIKNDCQWYHIQFDTIENHFNIIQMSPHVSQYYYQSA